MNALEASPSSQTETIVLGGGCFWCVEAAYQLLPGVKSAVSGYAGGTSSHPTYKQVCTGSTGHAEVVRIEFDPTLLPLEQLLEFFWIMHDPTTLNRQGEDVGTQYRSIILYCTPAQKEASERSLKKAQSSLAKPITTQIVQLTEFWPAEDYHQEYFANNPSQPYCSLTIKPKIDKLKKKLGMH
jgi:peptide-methionine (S)-S-oxide reductase